MLHPLLPHPTGSPQVDVSEQDGKRIITKTGVYQGTELHMLACATYHDKRLPERPDMAHLDFSQEMRAVTTDQQWQEVGSAWCRQGAAQADNC
jgi:hypothetical protein